MPLWGRRRRSSESGGAGPEGLSADQHRVQLVAQLADRLRFPSVGRVSERGGTWFARETGRTRTLMYLGTRDDRAARLVARYEAPGDQMRSDDALAFLQFVLDSMASPESRASAAGWVPAHPQGGILELPDARGVMAWTESADMADVSLVLEFAGRHGDQPAGGAEMTTSPITVPTIMAFASEEGMEWGQTTQVGELSEGTCRASAPDGSVRDVTYRAVGNSLVAALRVICQGRGDRLDMGEAWAFVDRALVGLLPEAERPRALELARGRPAEGRLGLSGGVLLIINSEVADGRRVGWVWVRAEEKEDQAVPAEPGMRP